MATKKASVEGQLFAWGGAAGLAALVFVLLMVLGGWLFIQALWMAAVTFLVVGAFNYLIFARPVPPLAGGMDPAANAVTPRATAPAAKSESKPAAKAEAAPAKADDAAVAEARPAKGDTGA